VCSQCNQYFGEKVENLALKSFPFLPFRVLLGIPTRKGAAAEMVTSLGIVRGSWKPGHIGLDPVSRDVEGAVNRGAITQLRILAEPTEPVAVCRMLLKMGIEVVAADSPEDARSTKFDSARVFARCPARNTEWWFVISTDHTRLFSKFRNGIGMKDWRSGVSLSVHRFDEFEAFRLPLMEMVIFTPLDVRVLPPDMSDFPEPDCRLFRVKN
jgi:hypothetical protein